MIFLRKQANEKVSQTVMNRYTFPSIMESLEMIHFLRNNSL